MKPLDRITGYAHVALRYGLEESIFLDSLMFWYKENRANQRNFRDGRWWTFNTVSAFVAMFPWWSGKQIRRIIASCKERDAILSGNYNEDQRDRTLWYTPSDELLELYGLCQKEEVHLPKRENETAQMDKCNKDNHEETTMDLPYSPPEGDGAEGCEHPPKKVRQRRTAPKPAPDWKPDRFARFWDYYPRGESKQAAIRAWDRLRPSDELIDEMARALERQVNSESWREGIGIPYASTWLNQQRWTDVPKQPRSTPENGGWAEDPEVT